MDKPTRLRKWIDVGNIVVLLLLTVVSLGSVGCPARAESGGGASTLHGDVIKDLPWMKGRHTKRYEVPDRKGVPMITVLEILNKDETLFAKIAKFTQPLAPGNMLLLQVFMQLVVETGTPVPSGPVVVKLSIDSEERCVGFTMGSEDALKEMGVLQNEAPEDTT